MYSKIVRQDIGGSGHTMDTKVQRLVNAVRVDMRSLVPHKLTPQNKRNSSEYVISFVWYRQTNMVTTPNSRQSCTGVHTNTLG